MTLAAVLVMLCCRARLTVVLALGELALLGARLLWVLAGHVDDYALAKGWW